MVQHEREEEKILKILLKYSCHDRQIMSRRDAEDEFYWKQGSSENDGRSYD